MKELLNQLFILLQDKEKTKEVIEFLTTNKEKMVQQADTESKLMDEVSQIKSALSSTKEPEAELNLEDTMTSIDEEGEEKNNE